MTDMHPFEEWLEQKGMMDYTRLTWCAIKSYLQEEGLSEYHLLTKANITDLQWWLWHGGKNNNFRTPYSKWKRAYEKYLHAMWRIVVMHASVVGARYPSYDMFVAWAWRFSSGVISQWA